jgi:hypothetical protein
LSFTVRKITASCDGDHPDLTRSGLDYIGVAAHNQISTWWYFVKKLLRSLLKAGVYFFEESDRNTADMADRVKDRVQNLSRRARHASRTMVTHITDSQ